MTLKRFFAVFCALALAVVFASTAGAAGGSSGSKSTSTKTSAGVKWSSTGTMTAAENAAEHWKKHGAEFPECKTKDAYIAAANAFVANPPKGTLTKKRDNGDMLFYNAATNTFAVKTKYGVPRTMFKPSGGKSYWDRQ